MFKARISKVDITVSSSHGTNYLTAKNWLKNYTIGVGNILGYPVLSIRFSKNVLSLIWNCKNLFLLVEFAVVIALIAC